MAAEVGVELPAYVEPLIGLLVALGSALAIRLGWMKAKNIEPEREVEMAGAVVDSRAVKTLVDAIDFALDRVTDLHDMRIRHDKQAAEDASDLKKEIRLLRKAIEDLTNKEIRNA